MRARLRFGILAAVVTFATGACAPDPDATPSGRALPAPPNDTQPLGFASDDAVEMVAERDGFADAEPTAAVRGAKDVRLTIKRR